MTDGGKMCKTYLHVNDNKQSLLRARADLTNVSKLAESQTTMSGTFSLSQGDQVWIETNHCGYFFGKPENAFSGWKV